MAKALPSIAKVLPPTLASEADNTYQLLVDEVQLFFCFFFFKLICLINNQVSFFKLLFLFVSSTNENHLACTLKSIFPHKEYENMFVEDNDGGSDQAAPL